MATMLSRLLDGDVQSLYWVGFLIADAHFRSKGKAIQLEISKQDQHHVEKFLTYLGSTGRLYERKQKRGKFGMISVWLSDPEVFPILVERFLLSSNKTIQPPDLRIITSKLSPDQQLSLIAGLIDGDGCIRIASTGRKQIALEMHSSWLENLCYIEETLYTLLDAQRARRNSPSLSRLNIRGHSRLVISDGHVLKQLKLRLMQLELPLLQRKWCIIDENAHTLRERTNQRIGMIQTAIREGKKQAEIARIVGVTHACISYLSRRYAI